MRFYVANTNRDFIPEPNSEGATATAENPKRVRGGSSEAVELQFLNGESGSHAPARYPSDAVVKWELKRVGEYTGDPVIPAVTFTRPSTDEEFYTATLDTSLAAVLSALNDADSNVSNDSDSITLAGEITVLLAGAANPLRTQVAFVTVENFYSQEVGLVATYSNNPEFFSISGGGTLSIVGMVYIGDPETVTDLAFSGAFNSRGIGTIDLTGFTALATLDATSSTGLAILDLRPCTALTSAAVGYSTIPTLRISSASPILTLIATNGAFNVASVDAAFIALDANTLHTGTVNFSGGTNAAPTSASAAARTSLAGKGWTITTN